MASFKRMHVFLPLAMVCFLSLHAVAAHRKLKINEPPIKRLLMSSSSPTFYNAFDTNSPNSINGKHPQTQENFNQNADRDKANEFKDIVDSEFNTKGYTNSYDNYVNSPFNTKGYTNSYDSNANFPFSTTNNYGNNENLPFDSTNTHQANGGQYNYPTTYGFSAPSSSSTPSHYHGKFPSSFEASLPDSQTGYGKQSFPSNDQQGLYSSPSSSSSNDAKSFFYKFPSKVDDSPSNKEEDSFKSASSYDAFHGGDINKSKEGEFDELKSNHHVSSYEYKNEKPVSYYDSFFNSPTIHQDEGSTTTFPFGRPKFPLSDHDLTYGHVQVP